MVFWTGPPRGVVAGASAGGGYVPSGGPYQQHASSPYQVVAMVPVFAAGLSQMAPGTNALPASGAFLSSVAGLAQGVAAVALGQGVLWTPWRAADAPVHGAAGVESSASVAGARSRPRAPRGRGARRPGHGGPAAPERRKGYGENDEEPEVSDCEEKSESECLHTCEETTSDLMARLQAGGSERDSALSSLRGEVAALAFKPEGCRTVQLALDVADGERAAELASELRGLISAAARSPHANFVVQKAVQVLPSSAVAFVAEELMGSPGLQAACHRYGCRILCRLAEHIAIGEATERLFDGLLQDSAPELCLHDFGRHVAAALLEHGLPSQKHLVVQAIIENAAQFATDRNASLVVERAFVVGDREARSQIAAELLRTPEDVVDLAKNRFGRHILQVLSERLADLSSSGGRPGDASSALLATKHGRRVLARIRRHENRGCTNTEAS